MNSFIKYAIGFLIGGVTVGGTVAVLDQSQKNKLRNEAKRAQNIAGRTVRAAEKLLEENERLKRQGKCG